MKSIWRVAVLGVTLLSGAAFTMVPSQDSLSDPSARDWAMHGRTASEQRFSPLGQISQANVAGLGLAWYHEFDTDRGQEATPIVVDGKLYVSTAWSKVFAFDAASGTPLWSYDPQVKGAKGFDACCDVVNRGVAVDGGHVFVGTLDGRLIALDRTTGKPAWSVQTTDPAKPYTITGAPRVVRGKVIIGNGGAEYGVRGYVSAYDAATGKLVWRFYTVPGDPKKGPDGAASDPIMAKAASTWSGRWYDEGGGGGTVWDSIVYDEELGRLYIGVGNGGPYNYFVRSDGKGDNLFLASIVALDPDTGRYIWHYQENPQESWDYTATQPIALADLVIDGKPRKVLMQAPKNGLFYVIDRTTGKPISATPYTQINWASGIDPNNGRPIEKPDIRYPEKPVLLMPGASGSHNWYPMAFNPRLNLAYFPISRNNAQLYTPQKPFQYRKQGWNTGIELAPAAIPDDQIAPIAASQTGALIAWDPIAGKPRWAVEHPYQNNGGVLATGGDLVFEGTSDGYFYAYAANTGKQLWRYEAGNGIIAGPISYAVGNVQYVAVMAGFGGSGVSAGFQAHQHRRLPGRLLVFRLGGTASAPAYPPEPVSTFKAETPKVPAATIERGRIVYNNNCMVCHGVNAISSILPDLRKSMLIADAQAFDAVVADGALADNGMVGFRDKLPAADIAAIRAYLQERSAAQK
ncbi:PQQ-dependent dehydrogenase, methanol/ethanol family [Flavisphingomonas formosensis]|uniref:PQQ-dependent dehydrogenase, methanol/ethanol family n=1 Tax=Flavisphingomonas formosensis TaxID=861534 RepID=UPI001E6489BC|nr:PQQ-dependent dehydrogenase, methanol/ethanol family [Sphingomonas formosensis]